MNKKKILATIVVISLVVLSFFSGNTFAKYLTQNSTTGSFNIAKWSVTEEFFVEGRSTSSAIINLATNYDPKTLVNGKIAPGTSGNFGVLIDTDGTDTGVDYSVSFRETSGTKPKNLILQYDGNNYSDLSDLSRAMHGNIPANSSQKSLYLPIVWIWEYETIDKNSEQRDIQDTLDGESISNYSFIITVTCTQEMPQV